MKHLIHVAFIAYIVIDFFFLRENLFQLTFPITKALQRDYGTPQFIAFNKFMALLLKPELCAMFSIFFFCMSANKYNTLKVTLYQCLSLYALLFYKNLMNDPRPYFVDSTIKGWECYADFGNPSGHATSVWMFYGIILVEVYREIKSRYSQKTGVMLVTKVVCLAVFMFLLIGIVFCRIFLGVHSLNQVMMGSVFGIYIFIVFLWFADNWIEYLFQFIREKSRSVTKKILYLSLILAALIQVPVEIYKILEKDVPQVWRDNVLNACPHMEESNMFYKVCFKACATIGIAFGVLFALILNKSLNHLVLIEFRQKNYSKSIVIFSFKNFLKALFGTSIFIAVFVCFYKIIPVSTFIHGIPLIYNKYYSMALGSFFSTFVLSFTFPWMYSIQTGETQTQKAKTHSKGDKKEGQQSNKQPAKSISSEKENNKKSNESNKPTHQKKKKD